MRDWCGQTPPGLTGRLQQAGTHQQTLTRSSGAGFAAAVVPSQSETIERDEGDNVERWFSTIKMTLSNVEIAQDLLVKDSTLQFSSPWKKLGFLFEVMLGCVGAHQWDQHATGTSNLGILLP